MTTSHKKTTIRMLPSGVAGLDTVLGGGIPEYSFNLIAGGPGGGKTTLAQQIAFAQGTVERPALYFSVLGEPSLKLLRHVQQYSFFDAAKFNTAVRFVNLSAEAMEQTLDTLLERIVSEMKAVQPGLVVVDSFRTITRAGTTEAQLQEFVQRLAIHLTSWEATTFLVGEYELAESHNPIFTVADGILWLTRATERHSTIRQLQITKSRGCAPLAGVHTFAISGDGVRVFPRALTRTTAPSARPQGRAPTGVPGLDAMMSGGIPLGDVALVVGPSGSGKSTLARHFIASGARGGQKGILAVFEERDGEYLSRSESFGPGLRRLVEEKSVEILSLRPLDLTVDELVDELQRAVARTGATRLAIDSLSGFELTLAPVFRDDFREAVFRVVSGLAAFGLTCMLTVSMVESFTEFGLSPQLTEFMADTVVLLRYVELDGKLEKVLAVVKMRSSEHETAIRHFTLGREGFVVGEPVRGYRGVLTGLPLLTAVRSPESGAPRPRKAAAPAKKRRR